LPWFVVVVVFVVTLVVILVVRASDNTHKTTNLGVVHLLIVVLPTGLERGLRIGLPARGDTARFAGRVGFSTCDRARGWCRLN
jgi:hypothetical protein